MHNTALGESQAELDPFLPPQASSTTPTATPSRLVPVVVHRLGAPELGLEFCAAAPTFPLAADAEEERVEVETIVTTLSSELEVDVMVTIEAVEMTVSTLGTAELDEEELESSSG